MNIQKTMVFGIRIAVTILFLSLSFVNSAIWAETQPTGSAPASQTVTSTTSVGPSSPSTVPVNSITASVPVDSTIGTGPLAPATTEQVKASEPLAVAPPDALEFVIQALKNQLATYMKQLAESQIQLNDLTKNQLPAVEEQLAEAQKKLTEAEAKEQTALAAYAQAQTDLQKLIADKASPVVISAQQELYLTLQKIYYQAAGILSDRRTIVKARQSEVEITKKIIALIEQDIKLLLEGIEEINKKLAELTQSGPLT